MTVHFWIHLNWHFRTAWFGWNSHEGYVGLCHTEEGFLAVARMAYHSISREGLLLLADSLEPGKRDYMLQLQTTASDARVTDFVVESNTEITAAGIRRNLLEKTT